MGSWGERLYDNDDALDALGLLADTVDLDASPDHAICGVALVAWLFPSVVRAYPGRIRRALSRAPIAEALRSRASTHPEAIALLAGALADPSTLLGEVGRDPAHASALGPMEAGTFHPALWTACTERVAANELAERCRTELDALYPELNGATFGTMAHAGVLLELGRVGTETTDHLRAARWSVTFQRACTQHTGLDATFDGYTDRAAWVLRRVGFDPFGSARRELELPDFAPRWRLLVVPTFAPATSIEPSAHGVTLRIGGGGAPTSVSVPFTVEERARWDDLVAEVAAVGTSPQVGHDGVMVCLETADRERVAWCPGGGTAFGMLTRRLLSRIAPEIASSEPVASALAGVIRSVA